MVFRLTDLAAELVVCIIEQVENRETLKSLSLTSKTLCGLTEPRLYRHNFFRTGREAQAFLRALTSQPGRQAAVQSLDARCIYGGQAGLGGIGQIMDVCPNLRDLTIESPFCNDNHWTECRGPDWAEMLDGWMMPLFKATSLSGPNLTSPPLQNLIKRHEYWHAAGTYASIFAHPSLQELRISSANLADDALDLVPANLRTPLKSLIFDQCNVNATVSGAIDKADKDTGEVDGGERPMPTTQWYNLLADGDPSAFELALSQQQASMKSLYYAAGSIVDPEQIRQALLRKRYSLNLSKFHRLEKVTIGAPCYQLERALLSRTYGPSGLKELKICGTNSTKLIRPAIPSNDAVQRQPRVWANYVISVAGAFPSLSGVEVVFGRDRLRCFTALPLEEIDAINAVNSMLTERGGKLSVAVVHPNNRFVPPILYGEHEPTVMQVFETDKGFVCTTQIPRVLDEQSEDEDDWSDSDSSEDDDDWMDTMAEDEEGEEAEDSEES
nr:hypothetical protein CFP56_03916 [Quercus suber]